MESTLGEDLVLLALRPNGTMHARHKLRFALSGSELLRLAEMGRVEVSGLIAVRDLKKTGDTLLDAGSGTRDGRFTRRPGQSQVTAVPTPNTGSDSCRVGGAGAACV